MGEEVTEEVLDKEAHLEVVIGHLDTGAEVIPVMDHLGEVVDHMEEGHHKEEAQDRMEADHPVGEVPVIGPDLVLEEGQPDK